MPRTDDSDAGFPNTNEYDEPDPQQTLQPSEYNLPEEEDENPTATTD